MADAAIVSSILGGFLRGLDNTMRETRERRAQVYLAAIQQNPALARTPEGTAALRSVGISEEEIPVLYPTPQERLQAAIPLAAAALDQPFVGGAPAAEGAPVAEGAPGPGAVIPGTPQFPVGLTAPQPGAPPEQAAAGGVPEDAAVGLDGQLRPLFQGIPAGATLEIDPVSGSLKITRRGPDIPNKQQADEPVVYRLFQDAVMALKQAFPAASDMEVIQRAAAETLTIASQQGLLIPETLQKIAFARFDTERELAAREAGERISLLYAQERAAQTALGGERGRQIARQERAREALTGTAEPPPPAAAGAPAQGAPAAGKGTQTGITTMPALDPDMDTPKWVAEAAEGVEPGRLAAEPAAKSGYVIGPKLGEQDIADAASFGLVLSRQPTGEWIAVPRTVAVQRKLEFEDPAVIAAARAGLRSLKDRTAMQTSALTARRVLEAVKQTNATSLLVSFGIPAEELQKQPLKYVARAAVLEGKAKANKVTIRMLARAGDPRAVALKALQGVATPFIKALGEVGQITEPDKAVVYNLLQRVWSGDAFTEEADRTIDYLLRLMQTVGQAPNISPAMARIMLNTDPRDPQAAEQALNSLRSAVEDSLNAPPGSVEAEGFLQSIVPGEGE